MAGELDPEELEEWRTIFNLFDVDGDESITCQELGVVLRSMGQNPSDQELKEMINEMDEDGSGTVDFEVGSDFVTFSFLLHNTCHFFFLESQTKYLFSVRTVSAELNRLKCHNKNFPGAIQGLQGKCFKNNHLFRYRYYLI